MFHQLIAIICALQMAFAAPQFVTFKDGKVGVNFGGYHADAGLGGLLTGNAAHGGLSASAGTPWGPRAAAGLNGGVDGRAAGGAYAGAQYNQNVGASSVLGGSVGDGHQGFAGAEAHADGKVAVKSIGGSDAYAPYATSGPVVYRHNIQKIKPPKKYSLIKYESETTPNNANSNHYQKDDDSNVSKKDIFPTVASHDHSGSDTTSITFATKATTSTTAEPVNHDGVIIVKQRQRERKHQIQQRRRLAVHPRRRAHKSERTHITYVAPPSDATIIEKVVMPVTAAVPTEKAVAGSKEGDKTVSTPVTYHKVKSVHRQLLVPPPPAPPIQYYPAGGYEANHNVEVQGGVVNSALNIPIGILRSLQESLSGLNFSKSVSFAKTA